MLVPVVLASVLTVPFSSICMRGAGDAERDGGIVASDEGKKVEAECTIAEDGPKLKLASRSVVSSKRVAREDDWIGIGGDNATTGGAECWEADTIEVLDDEEEGRWLEVLVRP